VTGTRGDAAGELSNIGRQFAGWHPWVSSGGRWWATRTGSLPADPPEWWAMTVDANDAEGLREQMARQQQFASAADGDANATNGTTVRHFPGVQDCLGAGREVTGADSAGLPGVPHGLARPAG